MGRVEDTASIAETSSNISSLECDRPEELRRAWRRAVKSWNNDNTAAQGAGAVVEFAAARKTSK